LAQDELIWPRLGSLRCCCGGAVTGLVRFLHSLHSLFRREQRRGLYRFASAPSGERDRNGGSADVVRHLSDQDNVVIAKGEPGILDLATQPLNGGANSFNSILRMGEQGLSAFPRVCDLMKKTWHTTSLRNFLPFPNRGILHPLADSELLHAFFIGGCGIHTRRSRRAQEGFGYFSALPRHPARNDRLSRRCRRFAICGFSSGKWRMVNRYSAMNQSGWSVVIQSS